MIKLKFVLGLSLEEYKAFREKIDIVKNNFKRVPNPLKTQLIIKELLGREKEQLFKSFIYGVEVFNSINEEIIYLLENRGYLIR